MLFVQMPVWAEHINNGEKTQELNSYHLVCQFCTTISFGALHALLWAWACSMKQTFNLEI